jgi:pyridoxamine 5'-phosphate oxidase
MDQKIADIRQNYSRKKLTEKKAETDPFKQFNKWWKQVLKAKITEPNAMTLATASSDGFPSARIVLLKDLSKEGFVFFTNYDSYKGKQLAENPKACLVFFWKELERQVRITGLISKLPPDENQNYFQSRPKESQLGAVVSPQSQVIQSREWLLSQFSEMRKSSKGDILTCPLNWGGYVVKPIIVEFWQGRPGRLHDRLQYTLLDDGSWKLERLAP